MNETGRASGLDVSRETLERLEAYGALLRKWNPAINLVSPHSLERLWERHFHDSAQIFKLAEAGAAHWADLGSGGGFPGLVIAILAKESRPDLRVTLVESDQRKAAFLATVLRALDLPASVVAQRIEKAAPLAANVLSARALAPLAQLFSFAERHLAVDGWMLFPKGARWRDEVAAAEKTWSFDMEAVQSQTESGAVVLKIKGLKRV